MRARSTSPSAGVTHAAIDPPSSLVDLWRLSPQLRLLPAPLACCRCARRLPVHLPLARPVLLPAARRPCCPRPFSCTAGAGRPAFAAGLAVPPPPSDHLARQQCWCHTTTCTRPRGRARSARGLATTWRRSRTCHTTITTPARERPDVALGVDGTRVGCWTDRTNHTGCTVVLTPPGAQGAVAVRGGAPGTREAAALGPTGNVRECHAVVLSGGSAFGLATADGVVDWCVANGIGYDKTVAVIPIVGAAIVFDLRAPDMPRPGRDAGWAACAAASADDPPQGVGRGRGRLHGRQDRRAAVRVEGRSGLGGRARWGSDGRGADGRQRPRRRGRRAR